MSATEGAKHTEAIEITIIVIIIVVYLLRKSLSNYGRVTVFFSHTIVNLLHCGTLLSYTFMSWMCGATTFLPYLLSQRGKAMIKLSFGTAHGTPASLGCTPSCQHL